MSRDTSLHSRKALASVASVVCCTWPPEGARSALPQFVQAPVFMLTRDWMGYFADCLSDRSLHGDVSSPVHSSRTGPEVKFSPKGFLLFLRFTYLDFLLGEF